MSVSMNGSVPRKSESAVRPVRPPTDLITVSEAARLLRISRRSIERLAGRGLLPFYALPVRGGLRFDRPALLEWLAGRHRESLETK
jgi:excisionase family DNA binding protein